MSTEGFQLITPSGYSVALDYTLRPDGQVLVTPLVSKLLPGGLVNERGIGDHPVSNVTGIQGTIEASFTTGTPGTAQTIAFLTDKPSNPTKYIGIALDVNNRPYGLMSVDGANTIFAISAPAFDPLPAGTPVVCRLAFSSLTPIDGTFYAAFEVNVDDLLLGWAQPPTATWTTYVPGSLRIGAGIAGAGLSDFVGKVGQVQVSSTVTIYTTPSTVEAKGSMVASLVGSSSVGATAKVAYAAGSTITANSSVSAVPSMTGP